MADLKTNYKDDVLNTSVNEKRKFNMIQNSDGTVSFEDVTEYTQTGDSFGAADINATNAAVNEANSNLNVQYNPKTDTVQIYYNGEWVDWKTGGLQTHWLYKDGESVVPFSTSIRGTSSYYAIDASFESAYVDLTSANSTMKCCGIGTNSLDLSSYTKMMVLAIIDGTERTDMLDISDIDAGCIVVSKRIYTDSINYFTYEFAVCNNLSSGYNESSNKLKNKEVIFEAGGVDKTVYIKRIWLE